MRTVGDILKKARLEKKLEFEEIEKHLKIRGKYLQALEENNWNQLPSLPYIKGFLRNYSSYLDLKPDEMLAIFRRQFTQQQKSGLLPNGLSQPLNEPLIKLTPHIIVTGIIISFLLLFFGYLAFQYNSYTSPPNLTITKPQEGEVIKSDKVQVTGQTDTDAVVSVNGQKIAVLAGGNFSTTLILVPGVNTITIDSTSKYGKKKTLTRTVQISEN